MENKRSIIGIVEQVQKTASFAVEPYTSEVFSQKI